MDVAEDIYIHQIDELNKEVLLLKNEISRIKAEQDDPCGSEKSNSYDFCRNIIEIAEEGMLVYDEDGKVSFVNKRAIEILGYSKQEILGKTMYDFMDEETRLISETNLLLHGLRNKYEQKFIRKDGVPIWTTIVTSAVKNRSQGSNGLLVLLTDISETKKTENILHETEDLYKVLFDSIDEGYCIIEMLIEPDRPLDYRFIEINEAFEKQSTLRNAKGKFMRELGPEHEEYWFEIYRDVALTGNPVRFERSGKELGNRQFSVYAFRIGLPHQKRVAVLFSDITSKKAMENALKENELRLQGMFNNAAIGISITDHQYRFIQVNDQLCKITGYSREELLQMTIVNLTHSEDHYKCEEMTSQLNNGKEGVVYHEKRFTKKDGTIIWVHVTASAIRDNQGQYDRCVYTIEDISERKMVEEALQKSREEFKTITDNSPEVIARFDLQQRHIFINPYGEKVYGRKHEEIIGKTNAELGMSQYLVNLSTKFFEEIITISSQKTFEFDFESPNFGHQYFLCIVVPEKNNKGEITSVLAITRDISDLKRTEEKLKESQQLLQTTMDNFPNIIAYKDLESRFVSVNKATEIALELPSEKIKGRSDYDFFTKEHADRYRELEIEVLNTRKVKQVEDVTILPNGEKIYHLDICFPLIDTYDNVYGVGYICHDITEIKKSEQKLRESERKYRLLYNNTAECIVLFSYVFDEKGEVVDFIFEDVNKATEIIMETNKESLLGKSFADILGIKITQRYLPYIREMRKENKSVTYEDPENLIGPLSKFFLSLYIPMDEEHFFASAIDITERRQAEAAVRLSEERFRLLADNISQFAWISNNEGKIEWINKRWFDYTGVSVEELNKNGLKALKPDQAERMLESFSRAIKSGEPWEDIVQLKSKEGEYRWFLARALPIRDENGNITLWFGTNTDITDRKQTEDKIARSEAILKQAETISNFGAWEMELINDNADVSKNPLHWSDQIYRIFGYEPDSIEVTVDLLFAHVHPDDRQKLSDALEKALNEKTELNIEHRITRVDGEERILVTHAEIQYDSNGKPIRVTGAAQDITERKKAEQMILESEEKFRTLFENITEGVALHELIYENDNPADYRFIEVNPAYKNYTGIDLNSMEIPLASKIYKTNELPYLQEYIKVAKSRQPIQFESFFPEQNKHFIINVISPKIGQFATVLEDISELKKTEHELTHKNEEMSRFIYSVSHDLKSPLITIKTFAGYLKEDIKDPDARDKDLDYIENAADKMGKMLDELLEISRIGRKAEQQSEMLLDEVVQSSIDLVAGRISAKKVNVIKTFPPLLIYGIKERFVQLYQNLIDNAVKFMGNQTNPEIEIGAQIQTGNEIVLFVKDNGIGVDLKYENKLFGLFEKIDTQSEGSGIGLALVKRIVELHGGRIWFRSKGLNTGTTFYFTFEKTKLIIT